MKKQISIFNYQINNTKNDVVEIHIDGDIVDASTQEILKNYYGDETSVSFRSFRNEISASTATKYKIFINSYGGHVGDALAIHDLIVQMRKDGKTVNTIGTGIVASSGTFILMSGDDPALTENSSFLIHNVSGAIWGDVNEVENYAKSLRKFNDRARDFYAKFTGKTEKEITDLMNKGQFMTAQEAENHGFVKKIMPGVEFTNSISPDTWDYADRSVLNSYNSQVKKPEDTNILNNIKKEFDNMKTSFKNFLEGLKAAKPENAEAQTIVNTVSDLMATNLENLSTEIDTEITNQVAEKTKNLVTEITAAVTESFKQQLADLKQENEDLAKEVHNKIGKASGESETKPTAKIIGGFKDGD